MMSRVMAVAAEPEVPELHHNELPMVPIAYGLIAFAVFMVMLGILWTFRNTAAKVSEQGHGDTAHGSSTGTHSDRSGH